MTPFSALPNAALFAIFGLLIFAAAIAILSRTELFHLWSRATIQSDTGAAIIIGAIVLGMAWIIAAAVH